MPVQIRRADLYNYVIGALERDIAAFRQALADHAKTEDVPAPLAVHSLVDALARSPDGAFVVAEDVVEAKRALEPPVTANDLNLLTSRISALEQRRPLPGEYDVLLQRVRQAEDRIDALDALQGKA